MATSPRRRTPEQIFKAAEEKIERARLRQATHLNLGERRRSLRRFPSLAGLTHLRSIKAPWTGIIDLAALADLPQLESLERWSHFLRQPVKVDSPIQRTNHHEDAETVFG
jgi:hypothetical protein